MNNNKRFVDAQKYDYNMIYQFKTIKHRSLFKKNLILSFKI